ncbi:MAG: LysR family transcriptional regulator [Myxococcaceae bacterium]|nr:LysR family transcriptional regulator [Myxococcaceae bacterium]
MAELETFRGVVPFVAVAEERSFRKAAARLGVSAAAVSKAVQALEADVGQSLFQRSTRAVGLTPAGELFFERCRQALASVKGGRDALAAAHTEPSGELVVSVPFIGAQLLTPALALLGSRFPRLTFDVRVTDQLSRFAEERVDVAVRIGSLAQSSLVARRLRATRLLTVAAPGWVARHGTPRTIDELVGHPAIVVRAPDSRPRPFLFRSGPKPVRPVMVVDHGPTALEGVLAGLGVSQAFDFMVKDLLQQGRLVELLPDEAADGPDVHAVCAPGRRASANVRAAFDAFAELFSKSP